MNALLRRALLGLLASLLLLPAPAIAAEVLRIGYQKYGTLVLLKARGTLEPELRRQGVEVRWVEFPGGPQLLEGLNVGSIDFGVAGETPPVFAQAAGPDLVYVASEPPAPAGEAIVVRRNSPIRDVAALKGRKVARQTAPLLGLAPPIVETAVRRQGFGAAFITPQVVAAQQRIADAFAREKLIPRPLQVAQVVWPPVPAPVAGR